MESTGLKQIQEGFSMLFLYVFVCVHPLRLNLPQFLGSMGHNLGGSGCMPCTPPPGSRESDWNDPIVNDSNPAIR